MPRCLPLLLCHLTLANSAYWNTASTLQPPSIQFVSLLNQSSYDNTTCAGRCCKRVEVSRAPDAACKADWRACAQLSRDSTAPRCGGGVPFPCSAWVPCEEDGSALPSGVLALVVLTVAILVYQIVRCGCLQLTDYLRSKVPIDAALLLAMAILGVFYALAIVIASEYEHFAASTEMNLDFVSYQSCVEYCNHVVPWDTNGNFDDKLFDTYHMFYCRDSTHNLSGFDLFPADHNHRPGSSECPTSWSIFMGGFDGWYCSSCFEQRGNWVNLRDISEFNRVRGYVLWTLLLVVAYLGVLMDVAMWQRWRQTCVGLAVCMMVVLVVSVFGHVACVVLDSVFLCYLDIHPGAKVTSGVVNKYNALGFYRTSIFVDLVGAVVVMGLASFFHESGDQWLKEHQYTSTRFLSNMGDTSIEPRDVVWRRGVV